MSFVAPNWRTESEYPSAEDHPSLAFWAWQFLRRNKDYQKEWTEYTERQYKMAKRLPELLPLVRLECEHGFSSTDDAKEFFDEGPGFSNALFELHSNQVETSHFTPSALPSERDRDEYERRMRSEGIHRWIWRPLNRVLGEKWGLNEIVNPANTQLGMGIGFLSNGASLRSIGSENEYADDDNYFTPVFDLRYPVDVLRAQFEWVLRRRELMIQKKRVAPYMGRPHRSLLLYRQYVRVLDAKDGCVGIPEIAESLLPYQDATGARKAVRNWLNAAEKIRGGNYKLLPAYSELPRPKEAK